MQIKACRACGSISLIPILDLGEQYISDFRTDVSKPPRYPVKALICEDCKLVQLTHNVPQPLMYHDNYGFKSGVNEAIKADLDSATVDAFQYVPDPKSWLDIASNDGTLLSFVPRDIVRFGVDPVTYLCRQALPYADVIYNDYFSAYLFPEDAKFDVVTSISCFYDMPRPKVFCDHVAGILAPRGIWVIQQNYLATSLKLGAIDNFCHEHLTYWTLLSLEKLLDRCGLEVVEVKTSMVNGGSIRTMVAHKGIFEIDESVKEQRYQEKKANLHNLKPYLDFADSSFESIRQLSRLVTDLKAQGNSVAILGASTRGSTIWQAAGLGPELIDYAVERNPAKVGRYFSAIGVPIISELEAHKRLPEYMIVGPWFFLDNIIEREKGYLEAGGKLIAPLPEVKIHGTNKV